MFNNSLVESLEMTCKVTSKLDTYTSEKVSIEFQRL
jgi:hypothetical protein